MLATSGNPSSRTRSATTGNEKRYYCTQGYYNRRDPEAGDEPLLCGHTVSQGVYSDDACGDLTTERAAHVADDRVHPGGHGRMLLGDGSDDEVTHGRKGHTNTDAQEH